MSSLWYNISRVTSLWVANCNKRAHRLIQLPLAKDALEHMYWNLIGSFCEMKLFYFELGWIGNRNYRDNVARNGSPVGQNNIREGGYLNPETFGKSIIRIGLPVWQNHILGCGCMYWTGWACGVSKNVLPDDRNVYCIVAECFGLGSGPINYSSNSNPFDRSFWSVCLCTWKVVIFVWQLDFKFGNRQRRKNNVCC